MTSVIAVPEIVSSAASDLAKLGSTINDATAAASAPTTGIVAAGADEVSAAVTALFQAHAKDYQVLSARAAAFHQQFSQALTNGSAAYAEAEAINASPLLVGVNLPLLALFGRPLIGNGASGVLPGSNGQPGGFLMGNGGNGALGGPGQNGGKGGSAGLMGNGGNGGLGGAGAAGIVAGNGGAGGRGGLVSGNGGMGGAGGLGVLGDGGRGGNGGSAVLAGNGGAGGAGGSPAGSGGKGGTRGLLSGTPGSDGADAAPGGLI